ncbi:hypothetical protein H5410_040149 [Solanum commersonii]|uniref:Pyruvate carboxyltransferase domain-containing protein n=1 Tax=Solanum commersonii TaxID=4109 RepID=A0A9J5XN22_SOLCO|nr:hypothetical protein H5410_040149 [Solanum commersonii]
MTATQKMDIARQLVKLGVDVIEAGFPASSEIEFELVKCIAHEIDNSVDEEGYVPMICGMARSTKEDINRAWESFKYAKTPMICTFIATSDIHMKYKLNMSREEVVERARSMVAYARSLGFEHVRFGLEDATRSDKEFVYHIIGEVIKAGATCICVADTVGCNLPNEFAQLIVDIKANTLGIQNVILAGHCHNDLGLATANTLAGIFVGIRQVDVTINGIGERAGNASLEEVEEYSGLKLQPHKAIVGANAFTHESLIHQDGILKNRGTYEFISAEDVGFIRASEHGIKLGKLRARLAMRYGIMIWYHDMKS